MVESDLVILQPISGQRIARSLILSTGDYIILVLCLAASVFLRGRGSLDTGLLVACIPLFCLYLAVFYCAGLYELRLVRDFVALIRSLLISATACLALSAIYFYVASPYIAQAPKTFLLLLVVFSHAAMLAWRRTFLAWTGYSLTGLRLLVLADSEHADYLRRGAGRSDQEPLSLAPAFGPDVDLVVADIVWIESHWNESKRILSAAVKRGVPVSSLERFYESMCGKVSPQYASDPAWALEHVLPRADGVYMNVRRLIEIVASAAGLIVLSPLLLLTAALIFAVDGIAPLYGQERVGYLCRTFTLWKFQTLRPDAEEAGPFQAGGEAADTRATRLGAVLRRFRLDELPQLWNVLRGEMSLVGPRPEWVKEVEVLEKAVPNYHLRHLVPPGITGWAQVYFRATSDPKDSIEKHHFDLYYLKNFSPSMDLSILLKTVKRVLLKDSSIGTSLTPFPPTARPLTGKMIDITSIIRRK